MARKVIFKDEGGDSISNPVAGYKYLYSDSNSGVMSTRNDIGHIEVVGIGYTEYVASITQTGVDGSDANPVVNSVLRNSVGDALIYPVWTRVGQGVYRLTKTGAFTLGKTFCNFGGNSNSTYTVLKFIHVSVDVIEISIFDVKNGLVNDNLITDMLVQVMVYS